jgi:hypothetical protein
VADRKIRHAALRDHAAVVVVDVEDALELAHADDDGVRRRDGTARQRCAGAARNDVQPFTVRVAQQGRDLRRVLGQHHGQRPGTIGRQSVGLVCGQPQRFVDHRLGRHQLAQRLQDLRPARHHRLVRCGQADHVCNAE